MHMLMYVGMVVSRNAIHTKHYFLMATVDKNPSGLIILSSSVYDDAIIFMSYFVV